jgi:hydrogenase maturation protein HypF
MAEHGLDGPVLGLAWDGTGFGTDGTAWGGELLLATFEGFQRLATFRPIPLAGGERAIHETWRTALALVHDAFEGQAPVDRLPVLAERSERERAGVLQMIASGLNAPEAHGVGRMFDAIGALALGHGVARFEAQVAMALEWAADDGVAEAYPFRIDFLKDPWQVDLRPLARAVVADVLASIPVSRIAARFHEALAAAAEALLSEAVRRHGRRPVVLTGGCFNNARLVEPCLRRLAGAGLEVRTHERVPAGDGGIALGQALIADAQQRKGAG